MQTYQVKLHSLQALSRLNATSAEERVEVDRMYSALWEHSSVVDYFQAQESLKMLIQATADLLSQQIGLDFVASCSPDRCCG